MYSLMSIGELQQDVEDVQQLIQQWMDKGKKTLRIVTAGKVGAGKSALVNALIGREVSREGDAPFSVTSSVVATTTNKFGIEVMIFDTPGLDDPQRDDYDTIKEIGQKTRREVDILLFCLRMTERVDAAHMEMINKLAKAFGEEIWTRAVFVLTFANEVKVQKRRQSSQPSPSAAEKELPEHFSVLLQQFRDSTREFVQRYTNLSPDVVTKIPIVPTGYDEPSLPDRDDWFSEFWAEIFKRLEPGAQQPLLAIFQDRIEDEQVPTNMSHMERPIAKPSVFAAIASSIGQGLKDKVEKMKSYMTAENVMNALEFSLKCAKVVAQVVGIVLSVAASIQQGQ